MSYVFGCLCLLGVRLGHKAAHTHAPAISSMPQSSSSSPGQIAPEFSSFKSSLASAAIIIKRYGVEKPVERKRIQG